MSDNLDLELTEGESDGFVNPEDIFVKRGEDGKVLPIEEKAAPFGKVLVRPITYGRLEELQAKGGLETLEAETVASLLEDHFVKPDLTGLTGDKLKNDMPAMAPQVLLLALFKASGVSGDISVNEDGDAEINLEGN